MSWWTETALDGIAGGVVGAVVTGGAVIWTVRHERRIRERVDRKAAIDEVRRCIAQLHGLVVELRWRESGDPRINFRGMGRMRAELLFAETSVRRASPESANRLKAIRSDLESLPQNSNGMYDQKVVHNFRIRAEEVLILVMDQLDD